MEYSGFWLDKVTALLEQIEKDTRFTSPMVGITSRGVRIIVDDDNYKNDVEYIGEMWDEFREFFDLKAEEFKTEIDRSCFEAESEGIKVKIYKG